MTQRSPPAGSAAGPVAGSAGRSTGPPGDSSWQAEADLLAEGRDYLERLCATTRYRHLFPGGPNMALLLRGYQELDRWRTVRRIDLDSRTARGRRQDRRRLRATLRRLVRADAIARARRLRYGYPRPRPRLLRARTPPLVLTALGEIDVDIRADVSAWVHGHDLPSSMIRPDQSVVPELLKRGAAGAYGGRSTRGLTQFRDALINAALAHPDQIPQLHPQYLQFAASEPPTQRRHPIATLLFVKLPLQLLLTVMVLLSVVYVGAYNFFNDARLGQFLGTKISNLLDGDLAFAELHWSPMLIVDLLTGQPTTVHGYGVEVWESHKLDGLERTRRTAYAEHLEVEIVIHEIIPWNRLGIPGMVEIPWVLHFEDIQNHGELWVDVRSYRNLYRDGEWMLSLVDAFDTFKSSNPPPDLKKLSFRIDQAELDGLVLTLDMEERSGWATEIAFDQLDATLDYENWAPIDGRPEQLPLRYELSASGGTGSFVLAGLVEGPIPIDELRELELISGMSYRPLGDLWIRGDADLGGSPSVFEGRMLDVFNELAFDFRLGMTDSGPMVARMFPPTVDEQGRERSMIDASGSPVGLEVSGPVDDIVLEVVGQGLTIDLFPEPGWAIRDVDASLTLARDPRPEMWASLGLPSGDATDRETEFDEPDEAPERASGGGDVPPEPDDGQRWIVYLDTFRGSAFDGDVRLHRRAGEDHIVLPGPGEPLLVSIYLDLLDVDLGGLTPDDPELAGMLRGRTSGGVQVHRVIVGEGGPQLVDAELKRVAITRAHGPADDNLPRDIRVDGEVRWDADEGLDLRGIRIGVDGGQLRLSGGLNAALDELAPTQASIRVDDGEAFLRAFGLPPWFDTLAADFSAAGPLSNPRGSGSLDVAGASSGAIAIDDLVAAKLEFQQGTLSLTSPNVEMLGGRGPLEAHVVLLANGEPLEDPKLQLDLRLEDINRADILGSGIGAKNATIQLIIDDGAEKPVPLSQLQARGGAYAETLTIAGVDYRDADASFAFTREGIQIDRMTLAYHRPVSPALFSTATVPVGRIEVAGTVGFSDDPSLALEVQAANVPLSAVGDTFGLDLPLRGQIATGSRLAVTGSLRKPDVEGQLVLAQLGAAGIPLGGGTLEFSSEDVPYHPADPEQHRSATAAHRRVQIEGALAGKPNAIESEGSLDWRVDATVAFGGAPDNAIEAAIDLRFANLPLDTLLTHPSRADWRTQIVGGFHDLVVETRYCPSHADEGTPMLAACAEGDPDDPRLLAGEPLRVDLQLAHFWYRGRADGTDGPDGPTIGGDPCLARDTTCSLGPLHARLDGDQLSLVEPWQIRSGGKNGPVLTVDGNFDLGDGGGAEALAAEALGDGEGEPLTSPGGPESAPSDAAAAERSARAEQDAAAVCVPGVPYNASLPVGTTDATITGALDFSALAPMLAASGIRPEGRLDIDLDITGVAARPTITGFVRLPRDQPIALDIDDPATDGSRRSRAIPVNVTELDLRMAGGTVYLQGAVEVFDEVLRLGEINRRESFIDIAGPCSGRYALGIAGSIDGALLRRLAPDAIESSGGAVELRELFIAGDLAKLGADEEETPSPLGDPLGDPGDELFAVRDPLFDVLSGTLSFERKAIRLTVQDLGEVRLASGIVEFRQCTRARPCNPGTTSRRDRGVAIWAGGRRSALSTSRPSDALTLRVGDRGRADIWGELVVSDSFDGLDSATVAASASGFPISLADNSGRTELEAELSAEQINFDTDDGVNGIVRGDVLIDRSVWLRDARQGVAVLSFADPNPAPPSQLPEFVRRLELDLTLRTAAPFRVDNNVAKKLEAAVDLRVGGTIGDPDLAGIIDVERGVVDIDILGGAYDVTGGRVEINNDLAQSVVNVDATRQKQIKVNNQLLTLNLHLGGTLDAIQWECSAPGDTSGAVSSTRGCVDYLIFDAGNTDQATSDVRETRTNNNLIGTRFLPLAGRLTQVELNEVLEREVPRAKAFLPIMRLRLDGVGAVIDVSTRPEWGRWGWGRVGLNFTYVRGYPGSVLRDSRTFGGRLEILENAAIEAAFGFRNYSNRVLVLDPPNQQSIQFTQHFVVPSLR